MQENIDQNSWKYKIAEQIVSSYKTDTMSKHIFENVIIKELLWHATTMIEGYKVPRGDTKGEYTKEKAMINIKIVGQRYWTKEAMETYIANNKEKKHYKIVDGLIHEHAVPRKIIKEKIIDILEKNNDSNYDKCIDEIWSIISSLSKSVVVTKEEDKKLDNEKLRQNMPVDWNDKDWDARYKESDIDYFDLNENKKIEHNFKFKETLKKKLKSI